MAKQESLGIKTLESIHWYVHDLERSRNFYTKSKRSILKARTEGPAAYVLPADDPRPGAQAELLRTLHKQGVEITRAMSPFTVTLPADEVSNSVPAFAATAAKTTAAAHEQPVGTDH